MPIITTIALGLCLIWLLTLIHEGGHYFIARHCGVRITQFAIGFGRTLFSYRNQNGVEFAFKLLPLGGYIKMLDEREAPVAENFISQAFNRQSLWARAAIIVAGPLANILAAIIIFFLLYCSGHFSALPPRIASIYPDSPASLAHFPPDSEIVAINNRTTPEWQSVNMSLLELLGTKAPIDFTLKLSDGTLQHYFISAKAWQFIPNQQTSLLDSLGVMPYFPPLPIVIAEIKPNSPAMKAGLKMGDVLRTLNDQPLNHWLDFIHYLAQHPTERIVLTVLRDNHLQRVSLKLKPIRQNGDGGFIGFAGIKPQTQSIPASALRFFTYTPGEAFTTAVTRSWRFISFQYIMLKKLVMGEISLRYLSGPISIFIGTDVALSQSWIAFFNFFAIISLGVATINLLPLPGLDGGHLLYLLLEKINGRPISIATQVLLLRLATVLLVLLTIQVTLNDISRLLS